MKIYMVFEGELKEINKPIFSSGDAFIVDDEKTIYIWLGKYCSVDEKAFAATKARELDEQRSGAAKIITLDQDQEIPEFLQLVGGMKIVEKNLARTMLIDVKTGDWAGAGEHINTLYRVSAEEFEDINTMKFVQVPFKKESLESEDCFIADLGDKIYIWQGSSCNVQEKVKAGQWARGFDAERAGLQNEVIFEEGDDAEFMKIFEGKVETSVEEHVQLSPEAQWEKKEEPEVEKEPELVIIPEPVKEPEPVEEPEPVKEPEPLKEPEPVEEPEFIHEPIPPPAKMDVETGILTIEKPTGRRRCPKCGEESQYMIHETIDHEIIILDYPRIYGKRYTCGSCGTVWREK
jgi:hypothetical protein